MAVFYVLPPRAMVAQRVSVEWSKLFPGLDVRQTVAAIVPQVTDALEHHADVHVLFQDDLPGFVDIVTEVTDGFGAEPGDQLVEVRWFDVNATPSVRVQRIPERQPCSALGEITYNDIE